MKKFLHVTKKILYRAIPFAVALIIFCYLPLGVSKVHAATTYDVLDYNDYVADVVLDDNNERVLVDFPTDLNFCQLRGFENGNWVILSHANGADDITFGGSTIATHDYLYSTYELVNRPLGFSVLDLSNVPDGTPIRIAGLLQVKLQSTSNNWTRMVCEVGMQYYDKDFKAISNPAVSAYDNYNFTNGTYIINYGTDGFIEKPSGAVYLMPRIVLGLVPSVPDPEVYIFVTNVDYPTFRLALSISSLYRLQEQSQKTNKLLAKLEEQNKNLINGTPEQLQQAGAAVDKLGSSGDKLGDLTSQMQVDKPNISADSFSLDKFVSASDQAILTAPIKKLWSNPTLLGMITLVCSLVLVSWVFFGKKG